MTLQFYPATPPKAAAPSTQRPWLAAQAPFQGAMSRHYVWDPVLRVTHWSLAACLCAEALIPSHGTALHRSLAMCTLGLLLIRLIWGCVGPHSARLARLWPSRDRLRRQLMDLATRRRRVHLLCSPLGGLMTLNLLCTLSALALSNLLTPMQASEGAVLRGDAHGALLAWAALSVLLHFLAVWQVWQHSGVNLIRPMVTGVKSIPDGATVDL